MGQGQAEAKATLAEQNIRYLSQYANDFIILLDETFHFVEVNERVVEGYRYTREELSGMYAAELRAPAAQDQFLQQIQRAEASGKAVYETVHRRKTGETFPVEVSLRVIDVDGKRLYQAVIRDITDRRQAEAQVQLLNEQLRLYAEELEQRVRAQTAQLADKNQELKEFAYTVSHDLKAPLRGIAGYANELNRRHRDGLGERAVFCVTQILTAIAHLDHLIEDLLRYSRLEAEMPSCVAVDLRRLVDLLLRDRDLTVKEQHIEVTVDVPFSVLYTWERGLAQVLGDLIDNAIKYSRNARPPCVRIRAIDLGSTWQVSVSDNGIGFEMKYHDRIFKLFNRLVRMEEFEGTGAGLAIAKKVIEKQGGRIWAESAPGLGATFFVELPKPVDET
jgi:PAS domain S-box-containing protein